MSVAPKYDQTLTFLSARNYEAVQKYWREYSPKSGPPICANASTKYSLTGAFTNIMYTKRSKDRIEEMKRVTTHFYEKEIRFVYEHRRSIISDPTASLSSCKLFKWMKEEDEVLYNAFKKGLAEVLNRVKSEPEAKIKANIVWWIAYVLGTIFIRL